MITKVTKENKGLYKSLFERASEVMGNDISSLDDYFVCFKTLTEADQVFKVLPLDEPTFDIDANTRVINIPKEFKNNGVSVKGDQVAEILYFTVDRYFETTDLYDDEINIIIQWEAAQNNGRSNQGISRAILKDVSILKDSGKMLFGWALNSDITEYAGNIKFSVRFYRTQLDENNKPKITFSLSTLTANAIVNPGLDYEFVEGIPAVTVYDDSALINNRIKDSVYISDSDAAALPEFSLDLAAGVGVVTAADGTYLVDLVNGNYTFTAVATSNDGGIISYEWYRKPLGSEATSSLSGNSDVYKETEDVVYSAAKVYYVKETTEGIDKYTVKTGYTSGTEIPEEVLDAGLYERFAERIVANTGDYWVVAKNRHGIASKTLKSAVIRIPGPADLAASVVGLEADDENIYHGFLEENGSIALRVSGTTTQSGDNIVYTWKDADGVIDDANAATYTVAVANNENAKMFDKNFTAEVFAERNGDETVKQSFNFRVTHEVEPVVVVPENNLIYIGVGEEATLKVIVDDEAVNSDSITYQWCVYTADENDEDVPVPPEEGKPSNAATFKTSNANIYVCRVTNHLNGHEVTTVSDKINVIATL